MESSLSPINIEASAVAEAAGAATADERAALEAAPAEWAAALRALILETEDALRSAQRITGEEREQVLADLTQERDSLRRALRRLLGEPEEEVAPAGDTTADAGDDHALPAVVTLQGSWSAGRVVVWAGGPRVAAATDEELDQMLADAGAAGVDWEHHEPVAVPGGTPAPARSAPLSGALGWLVGVGAGQLAPNAGPSLRWLSDTAVWGAELVAQGRMVPSLGRSRGSGNGNGSGGGQGAARFRVRWVPAVVDAERLTQLARRMPRSVVTLDAAARPEAVCRAVLGVAVDIICRAGASRLVAPATSPLARNRTEVSEAVLAGLDGEPFQAVPSAAGDLADELKRWSAPVTGDSRVGLSVRLDRPEADGGWLLTVAVTGVERQELPAERALASASRAKAFEVEAQLRRLERLLPALRRPSSRRGEVILGNDEAWELMADTGPVLAAAGFDVQVPNVSRRRPSPRLRLQADAAGPSVVGAQQLSKVRWSVLFDDVELTAAEVARLAGEARPLVQAKGRWVELDRADLQAAAAALAERAATTEMSGGAILRHAVGLEGSSLAGPVSVEGSGWAVDLVRGATSNPPQPVAAPAGFVGELREYQAEAMGWLSFLDGAGLGGCLALDMGLGKTPTVLAHLLATRGEGPVLVIAPPAVLTNWAAEAKKFTPALRTHVHHGPERAEGDALKARAADCDIVLTTYATAVRDVAGLAAIEWRRLVVDEAQAIKNPASETAQGLREIPAQSRLALTGTPVENGLGDLWAILDFTNPGLVGPRPAFIEQLSKTDGGQRAAGEAALRALNGLLVFRRTKAEPAIAAELPDKIDQLDHCAMTPEQVGLYQAVLDRLLNDGLDDDGAARKGQVLAAITALKQICDHPAAYINDDHAPLVGRSGKLARLEEIVDAVFAAGERVLVFTHFARWGERLAEHLTAHTGLPVACYHGGLSRPVRDRLIHEFQEGEGPGALVLSLKAGGSGLNLTAASHVVLYDRWWNPAVEDQARDRAWRIGQKNTVVSHRLVCPGTVDERVEEVVAGKRRIADLVLPASSSLSDLGAHQLRAALGLRPDELIEDTIEPSEEEAA